MRELTRWKLGLKGERAVGQYLQGALLPLGYFVIHDVRGDNFNIDHVVIGPSGVFAIEVKTRSRPEQGRGKIVYDGRRVVVDGYMPDRDPIDQAQRAARSLQKILEERAGRKIPVRSVVLFPRRWIDRQPRGVETWALNEKAFIKFIECEPTTLSPADSRVFAEGLARYVRERID
jgi:hypothetical protein